MKLIFALGNPGSEYENTRHNVGFMALDYYREKNNLPEYQYKKKFLANISQFSVNQQKVILAKPTTFYNNVGQSAQVISNFYSLQPDDILILHDELALDFGTIRTRSKGSDAGNNGIRSLVNHIGADFWRIRIGTKNSISDQIDSADFVLNRFSTSEQLALVSTEFEQISKFIDEFIADRLEGNTIKT